MNDSITVTYKGIVIAYDEYRNRWMFVLRGREKSSESLSNAKETIDKPAPKATKPFTPIPAWYIRHSSNAVPVEVTSVAENGYGRGLFVWIKCGKQRSKESVAYSIYPRSDKNDELCRQMESKRKQMESIDQEIDKLKRALDPLVIEKEPTE